MSGYLANLVSRTFPSMAALQPRVAPLFGPASADPGSNPRSRANPTAWADEDSFVRARTMQRNEEEADLDHGQDQASSPSPRMQEASPPSSVTKQVSHWAAQAAKAQEFSPAPPREEADAVATRKSIPPPASPGAAHLTVPAYKSANLLTSAEQTIPSRNEATVHEHPSRLMAGEFDQDLSERQSPREGAPDQRPVPALLGGKTAGGHILPKASSPREPLLKAPKDATHRPGAHIEQPSHQPAAKRVTEPTQLSPQRAIRQPVMDAPAPWPGEKTEPQPVRELQEAIAEIQPETAKQGLLNHAESRTLLAPVPHSSGAAQRGTRALLREGSQATPEPVVEVTIGRIEVRAMLPAERRLPQPRPALTPSLAGYLRRRSGEPSQ